MFRNSSPLLGALVLTASCGAESVRWSVIGGDGGVPPPIVDAGLERVAIDVPATVDLPQEPAAPELSDNGAACQNTGDCKSGFCVDGVCCDGACTGLCLSCGQTGKAGTCSPVVAGMDPQNECADDGAPSCGKDGFCDGAGACRRYAMGTTCATATCTNAMLTPAGTCNAQGMCQRPPIMSCGKFQCNGTTACRIACTMASECVSPAMCTGGFCGVGLTGQYFNNQDFTAPELTRIDPNLNFDWMAGSPANGVDADTFSVRWTGLLTPKYSELYTFYIASSDGERMFLDDMSVVNNFVNHTAAMEDTGMIMLTAGRAYRIRVELYEEFSNASIRLSWSSASQAKEVIPPTAFSPQ